MNSNAPGVKQENVRQVRAMLLQQKPREKYNFGR